MMRYMFNSKIWFIDATFRVVQPPFRQLLVVHILFIRGGVQVSIPCFFILMSSRTYANYILSFEAMLRIVDAQFLGKALVNTIVIDFEFAMWKAFRVMIQDDWFASVSLKGCTFHFAQCIYRRVMYLHLVNTYKNKLSARFIIKSFMSLTLLPLHVIPKEFAHLQLECYKAARLD